MLAGVPGFRSVRGRPTGRRQRRRRPQRFARAATEPSPRTCRRRRPGVPAGRPSVRGVGAAVRRCRPPRCRSSGPPAARPRRRRTPRPSVPSHPGCCRGCTVPCRAPPEARADRTLPCGRASAVRAARPGAPAGRRGSPNRARQARGCMPPRPRKSRSGRWPGCTRPAGRGGGRLVIVEQPRGPLHAGPQIARRCPRPRPG